MSLRKPFDQRFMIRNPFVKHHPLILHASKSILPGAITIMPLGRWGFKQLGVVYQEFFRKHGFATSRRTHHQDRGGGMKTKRFPRLHVDDTTQGKKKAPFYWNRWDSNPRTTSLFFPRGIQRLYPLSYDSDTIFSNKFYLTITLMIRMTTKLIPSGFLTYNQLLKALTGLMVIVDIIMIRKLI